MIKKTIFLFTAVFLLFFPWGNFLGVFATTLFSMFVLDLIRIGLSLCIFIIPGALLYVVLYQKNKNFHDWLGTIPVGFVLSFVILALIGLLARFLGLSFLTVKNIYLLICILGIFLSVVYFADVFAIDKIRKKYQLTPAQIPFLLAIIFSIILTFHDQLFFIDDTTYAAYARYWQKSENLGFYNLIHEPEFIENERFWLALYPMFQSFIAEMSGVPVILLFSNYLELFLVPLAIITGYWFARSLNLSRRQAGFSVLIQLVFYAWLINEYWPVGVWFIQSMIEDKVSAVFLLSPVFFVVILRSVENFSLKHLFFVFFTGIGLTLTHPVILFFACLIASGMLLLAWFSGKVKWNHIIVLYLIFFIIMSPYLFIRLWNYSSDAGFTHDVVSLGESFQVERYVNILNDHFYGMNPELLKFIDIPFDTPIANSFYQAFRWIPVFVIVVSLIFSFLNLRQGRVYWYIAASTIVILLVLIPYTGWLFGFLTNARLMYRVSWFMPFGVVSVILLKHFYDYIFISKKFVVKPHYLRNINYANVLLFLCVVLLLPFASVNISGASRYFEAISYYSQLASIGNYIDAHYDSPVVGTSTDYTVIQMLPGASANTRLITFREEKPDNGHNFFLSLDEIHKRTEEHKTIRSLDVDIMPEVRCPLLSFYNVKYVISNREDAERYVAILEECNLDVYSRFQTQDFVLFEIVR